MSGIFPQSGSIGMIASATRSGAGALKRRLCRTPLYSLVSGGPSPTAIIATQRDVIFGNARMATSFYRGRFALAGIEVNTGARSPFQIEAPNARWREELLGFDWLRHLRAADSPIAAAQARACVSDWIDYHGVYDPVSWRPHLLSRRLSSWLTHNALILNGASRELHEKVMTSIGRQLRYLAGSVDTIAAPAERLKARCSVVQAFMCLEGCERYLPRAVELLNRELETQISPDGGHISRNPRVMVELLICLIPLRDCFGARDLEVPQVLMSTVDRMLPMLRMMLHTDGGLAVFNGVTDTAAEQVAAILDTDMMRGRPLTQARYNGYQRIAQDRTILIVDTGAAPPARASAQAHAGCLAFELSHGRHRIITNCGAPGFADTEWQDMARTTAAHSTVAVNNRSSSEIAKSYLTRRFFGHTVVSGPASVTVEREDAPGGTILEASHDGYLKRLGLIHSRRLYLTSNGADLRGEDCINRVEGKWFRNSAAIDDFAIRFHLHPSVKATLAKDATSVLLLLPNHIGWRFTSVGGRIGLEDSVYLADTDQPRRSQQIVVQAEIGDRAIVKWALKKAARRDQNDRTASESSPGLPFEADSTN